MNRAVLQTKARRLRDIRAEMVELEEEANELIRDIDDWFIENDREKVKFRDITVVRRHKPTMWDHDRLKIAVRKAMKKKGWSTSKVNARIAKLFSENLSKRVVDKELERLVKEGIVSLYQLRHYQQIAPDATTISVHKRV